jgi:ADP-ribosyl-[dinitrogen reductase] hydrolase
MRVLPLALWHVGSDEELVRDARLSSLVTHGHARSQVCCALHCLWARELMQDSEDAWLAAVRRLRAVLAGDAEAVHQLEAFIYPDSPARGTGSGYVVDTLRSARMVMERGSYEQVVKLHMPGSRYRHDRRRCRRHRRSARWCTGDP